MSQIQNNVYDTLNNHFIITHIEIAIPFCYNLTNKTISLDEAFIVSIALAHDQVSETTTTVDSLSIFFTLISNLKFNKNARSIKVYMFLILISKIYGALSQTSFYLLFQCLSSKPLQLIRFNIFVYYQKI